jgi:subtilisin family serine protease
MLANLVGCRVELATGATQCERLSPEGTPLKRVAEGAIPSPRLDLIPDAQWMVETEPGAYTRADSTYRFNLRVTNDSDGTLGTSDGTRATGLKVFLPVRVMGYTGRPQGDTSDPYGMLIPPIQNTNNTVHARNPDGIASFTAEGQPYWHYPEILAPSQTSAWREWQFTVDPSVSYFYFAVSIFTHAAGKQPVTSRVPEEWLIAEDSVKALFVRENLIFAHPRVTGPYPRDVVMITFAPSATADERQAAVDHVGGALIGGDGAYYFVRVRDGAEPVWSAIDRLAKLPQIDQAMPFVMGETTTYLRPNNTTGWKKTDWELHPDSGRGLNWAPDAIAAPAAWGCETGNGAAKLAVIDQEPWHGRYVGGVLGNPGNDTTRTAGIIWGGSLVVYDASRDSTVNNPGLRATNRTNDLRAAIQVQKARVINLSLGTGYTDAAGNPRLPIVGDSSDIQAALNTARAWRTRIQTFEADSLAGGHRPLYVIAAGNYQVDASYSGLPQLVNGSTFSDRVIVVAAADSARTGAGRVLWANSGVPLEPGSNTGSLPSIAAPGGNIHIMTARDTGVIEGTSFAAPHVAGIAGLLFSQDPSRTAQDVRTYIQAGAARGRRTAGGYPLANAYESLKRGAEQSGAPLCGNRVWAEGAQIWAQRGSGKESIGPADTGGDVADILTQHGGRVILYNNVARQGKALHRGDNGTWALGTVPSDYNTKIGGATWSVLAYSHGADSVVALNTSLVNNNSWWRTGSQANVPIILRTVANPNGVSLGTLTIRDLPDEEARICVERIPNGGCTYTLVAGRYWLFRVAYPQVYQPLLITVTTLQTVFADSTPWRTCTRDSSLQCRNSRTDFKWSAATVYKMPLSGGTPQVVDTLPHPVLWMGQTEAAGSDSLVMGTGRWISEYVFNPDTRSQTRTRNEIPNCAIEYRSLATLARVGHRHDNPNVCYWSSLTDADDHGGGSFAPIRAPSPQGGGSPGTPTEMRIDIGELLRASGIPPQR